jgi:hypothetical protein
LCCCRERDYPQLWAALLEKHDGDKDATLKEYHKIKVLAKVCLAAAAAAAAAAVTTV